MMMVMMREEYVSTGRYGQQFSIELISVKNHTYVDVRGIAAAAAAAKPKILVSQGGGLGPEGLGEWD